jgi:hypothetical protein
MIIDMIELNNNVFAIITYTSGISIIDRTSK